MLCRSLNPRMCWCFSSEAYMGKCRILALACNKASGNGKSCQSCNYCIRRYLAAMHLTLQHPDMWVWRAWKRKQVLVLECPLGALWSFRTRFAHRTWIVILEIWLNSLRELGNDCRVHWFCWSACQCSERVSLPPRCELCVLRWRSARPVTNGFSWGVMGRGVLISAQENTRIATMRSSSVSTKARTRSRRRSNLKQVSWRGKGCLSFS